MNSLITGSSYCLRKTTYCLRNTTYCLRKTTYYSRKTSDKNVRTYELVLGKYHSLRIPFRGILFYASVALLANARMKRPWVRDYGIQLNVNIYSNTKQSYLDKYF